MNRKVKYILFTFVCTLLVAAGSYIDAITGLEGVFETSVKVLISMVLIVKMHDNGDRKKLKPVKPSVIVILLVMLPSLINIVRFGHFDLKPDLTEIISLVIQVMTTAIWEEMCFRYLGIVTVDGKINYKTGVWLSGLFALQHIINLIYMPLTDVLFQMILAYSVGLYLLGIYKMYDNVWMLIASHFMLNLTSKLPHLLQSSTVTFLPANVTEILFWLIMAAMVTAGVIFVQ